jgi:hypothetical protein
MTEQVYKSAKGKTVDMSRLSLIHENMPAVGNAGFTARGDQLAGGIVVKTREELLQEYYNQNPRNI